MSCSADIRKDHSGMTEHGGLDYRRLREIGIDPSRVLDFSVSINPFGPHPSVLEAAAGAVIGRYPDPASWKLTEKAAAFSGTDPSMVLVTNGLSQAIRMIARAFSDRGDKVLVCGPTFGEYEVSSFLVGDRVIRADASPESGFAPPLSEIHRVIKEERPVLVWLCNPNNPTGIIMDRETVEDILRECRAGGSILVVDEAYMNFTAAEESLCDLVRGGNLIVMKSMTKDFALTGLRLGYVVTAPEIRKVLAAVQPPWSINAPAQEGGAAALEKTDYYRRTWRDTHRLTMELYRGIVSLDYTAYPPAANFILFRVDDLPALKGHLWKDLILVRDCTSFGLENYVRVGTGKEQDNARLLAGLESFRSGRVDNG